MREREFKVLHKGREIYAVSVFPEQEGAVPVVIFSHGFNGTADFFRESGELLAENGIGAVALDFCGGSIYSRSSMDTTEMTVFTEKEDLCAVLDEVRSWENVDKSKIFLHGESQGGLVTALTCEERSEDVAGMLLLYPAFCIEDDWRRNFPKEEEIPLIHEVWGVKLGKDYFQVARNLQTFSVLGGFSKDILVMHGDEDAVVPLAYSERIVKIYPKITLEVFQGEGHGFTPQAYKRMSRMVLDFVQKHMD